MKTKQALVFIAAAIIALTLTACPNEPESGRTPITKPQLDESNFTYSGSSYTVALNVPNNNAYTLSGDVTKTDAGQYSATVTLVDTDNTEWDDGTTSTLNLAWTIAKLKVAKPELEDIHFVFDGDPHTVTLTVVNDALYTLGGVVTETDYGYYKATVTLTNTNNLEWEDGTIEALEFEWSIGKEWVTRPVLVQDEFPYTGTAHTVQLNLVNNEAYTLSDHTATDAGSYTAKVTLEENFEWYYGSDEVLELPWIIKKADPVVTTWPTADTITYGAALSTSALTGGVGLGTFAWTTGTTIPTVTNNGYEVTFTPTDSTNYNTLAQTVTITVNKADPVVTTWPTAAAITYGAALSTSALTGGVGAGNFAWTTGTTIPAVTNNGFEVTFTPTDAANFNTLTETVAITVNPAPLGGNVTITPNTNVTTGRVLNAAYSGNEEVSFQWTIDNNDEGTGTTITASAPGIYMVTAIPNENNYQPKDSTPVNVTSFIPIENISPTFALTIDAGTPLALGGTANPSTATNRANPISWEVINPGDTEGTISNNTLHTVNGGTITIRATITNGTAWGTDYTEDFTLSVNAAQGLILSMGDFTIDDEGKNQYSGDPVIIQGTGGVTISLAGGLTGTWAIEGITMKEDANSITLYRSQFTRTGTHTLTVMFPYDDKPWLGSIELVVE